MHDFNSFQYVTPISVADPGFQKGGGGGGSAYMKFSK